MKRITILLLIGIIAPLLNVRAAQDPKLDSAPEHYPKFNVIELSQNGRNAYEKLLNAGVFAVGPVGWGAQPTEGELALHVLLAEKEAARALKSLINVASPEGSLYALLGLRLTDMGAFRLEAENFKNRPESPKRSLASGRFATPKGQVKTGRGCIIFYKPFQEFVSAIQSGDYDQEFKMAVVRN